MKQMLGLDFALKSDYFRIEITLTHIKKEIIIELKSDYFRIEIDYNNKKGI